MDYRKVATTSGAGALKSTVQATLQACTKKCLTSEIAAMGRKGVLYQRFVLEDECLEADRQDDDG